MSLGQAEVEVETWDAIRARRNLRSYSGQAIASGDLDQILEAARRTPSAGNQRPWDLVVCTPIARSPRSSGPTGAGSRTSCTTATGSSPSRIR